jgi:hypothetical protein
MRRHVLMLPLSDLVLLKYLLRLIGLPSWTHSLSLLGTTAAKVSMINIIHRWLFYWAIIVYGKYYWLLLRLLLLWVDWIAAHKKGSMIELLVLFFRSLIEDRAVSYSWEMSSIEGWYVFLLIQNLNSIGNPMGHINQRLILSRNFWNYQRVVKWQFWCRSHVSFNLLLPIYVRHNSSVEAWLFHGSVLDLWDPKSG